jgi:hypothetical protein
MLEDIIAEDDELGDNCEDVHVYSVSEEKVP